MLSYVFLQHFFALTLWFSAAARGQQCAHDSAVSGSSAEQNLRADPHIGSATAITSLESGQVSFKRYVTVANWTQGRGSADHERMWAGFRSADLAATWKRGSVQLETVNSLQASVSSG